MAQMFAEPRASVTEQHLIARVRRGEPAAQREMYDAHVDRVYRVAYRIAGDEELARDFTQLTFIRAFEQIGGFRAESSLSTWLHSIGVSVALNGVKKVKRLHTREASLEEAELVGSIARSAEPDLKERLRSAIDGLNEKFRIVFLLHDVEGFTHEEIGELLKIPSGTSKTRLFQARGKLREELADFAGDWAS